MVESADYTSAEAYAGLVLLHGRISSLSYVLPPVSFWATDFQAWCNETTFCPANKTRVQAFLEAYPHYKGDVLLGPTGVVSSRQMPQPDPCIHLDPDPPG